MCSASPYIIVVPRNVVGPHWCSHTRMTHALAYVVNGTMSSMSMDCVPALQVHQYIECIGMCNGIFIEFSSIYSLTCRLVAIVDCHTSSCYLACLIPVCHLSYSVCPDQGSLPAPPPGSPNTASSLNLLVHHILIYIWSCKPNPIARHFVKWH